MVAFFPFILWFSLGTKTKEPRLWAELWPCHGQRVNGDASSLHKSAAEKRTLESLPPARLFSKLFKKKRKKEIPDSAAAEALGQSGTSAQRAAALAPSSGGESPGTPRALCCWKDLLGGRWPHFLGKEGQMTTSMNSGSSYQPSTLCRAECKETQRRALVLPKLLV